MDERREGEGPASGAAQPPPDKPAYLDRAYEEYCRLLAAGDAPDLENFCAGYPTFQSSLRRLLDAHRFLEEDLNLLAEHGTVTWPEPGEAFLGFTLLAELGRGAFARVFLANQSELGGRLVAVKVALQGAPEAETLGRLCHPNIVTVHSIEEDPFTGLTAVCMPFLGRATLCDVLDHAFAAPGVLPRRARVILDAAGAAQKPGDPDLHRLPPNPRLRDGSYIDGVLHLVAQLADALAFTHGQAICHRDLKPSNVLLTPDGRPMLLDFNLSADERGGGQPLGGTLPYMAPEQLRATDPDGKGDPSWIGPPADLFSLGVILYELLAGKHPFGPLPSKRTSQELRAYLLERQKQGPVPLRRLNPQVDGQLARLVERCLSVEPSARCRSAEDLAAALRKSQGRLARARRWFVQHTRAVLVSAGLTLAVGAAGAYGLSLHGGYQQEQGQSQGVGAAGAYGLSMRESYAQHHYNKGVEAYLQQADQEAIENLTWVIEADPQLAPRALFLRGRCQQRLGNLEAAEDDYRKADPDLRDADVQVCLAWCRSLMVGKQREAHRNYVMADKAGADSAEFFNNWGRNCWLLEEELRAHAEGYLNWAIAIDPKLKAAYHNRALLHFRKALDPVGNTPEVRAQFARERLEAGIADIEKAFQLGAPTTDLYRDAAHLYAHAAEREPDLARRQVRKKLALDYARLALEHGQDPELLWGDPVLSEFRSELGDVIPSRPLSGPTRAVLFVDPMPTRFERAGQRPN